MILEFRLTEPLQLDVDFLQLPVIIPDDEQEVHGLAGWSEQEAVEGFRVQGFDGDLIDGENGIALDHACVGGRGLRENFDDFRIAFTGEELKAWGGEFRKGNDEFDRK